MERFYFTEVPLLFAQGSFLFVHGFLRIIVILDKF